MIFQEHWKTYLKTNNPREIEIKEVEKMLSCKDESRGGFWYFCKTCNDYRFIPFGCNSRLCSCYGKRYADQWSSILTDKLEKEIYHRHIVFTIPDMLWKYFQIDRNLYKVLMDVSNKTIKETFSKVNRRNITPGVLEVFHPFGKDLKFQPHVHMIVTEGGFDREGKFVSSGNYIPFNALHKYWKYNILRSLRKYLPKGIVDLAYRKYPDGFCVYARKDRITSRKGLAKYLGRYIRHPAIANSRITSYNEEAVKYYWMNHDDSIHYKILNINDFISALIQHIPEKNQKLIRYYGYYSRKNKKCIKSSIIIQKSLNIAEDRSCYCPVCHEIMEFVIYAKKPPLKDMSKISSWMI